MKYLRFFGVALGFLPVFVFSQVKSTEVTTPLPTLKNNAGAAPLDAETKVVLRSVSERYKKLGSWEAHFAQETFSVGLGKGTYNEGRFIFSPPNKFRYSLVRPEASDFISDGKKAWYVTYRDGREKPAYVRVFNKVSDIELDRYLIMLRGIDVLTPAKEKKLLAEFNVTGTQNPVNLTLEFTPKKSAEIAKIVLIFKNDQPAPEKAIITDSIGNSTTIKITATQTVKKILPKEFVPDYPKESKVETL